MAGGGLTRGLRRRACGLFLGLLAAAIPAQDDLVVESADRRVPAATVAQCQALATASLDRLRRVFPGMPRRPIRLLVHTDAATVDERLLEGLPNRFAGFARLGADECHVLVMAAGSPGAAGLRAIITHELAHVLLDQYALEGAPHVPRWLHEGLAQTLAGEPLFDVAEESLMFGISTRTLPRFGELTERFPERADDSQLAYAQSHSFVAFLVDTLGTAPLLQAARSCRADLPFDQAFYRTVDTPLATLQEQWEEYLLYRSGAISRFLQRHCFTFLMVLGLPLLALAVVKRRRRERERRQRLAAQDEAGAPEADE